MDYHTLDDVSLIDLTVRRDERALSELYDRYSGLVYSIAYHLLGDHPAAEEIALDVFTRVWERAGLYQPALGRVSTWLASIARHRAIDRLRRRASRPEGHSLDQLYPLRESRGNETDPEEYADLAIGRERVRHALDDLPDEQRQALELAYYHGLTHREIAGQLGLPIGTVKTRLRLALQKLRDRLADAPDSTDI